MLPLPLHPARRLRKFGELMHSPTNPQSDVECDVHAPLKMQHSKQKKLGLAKQALERAIDDIEVVILEEVMPCIAKHEARGLLLAINCPRSGLSWVRFQVNLPRTASTAPSVRSRRRIGLHLFLGELADGEL